MAKLSIDTALLKAKAHIKRGETAEAQKLYQTVLQAFPKNKKAQKGLTSLNKQIQANSIQNPPQKVINQLVNFYNQGQLFTVVERAQKLTKQYPKAFDLWNILGVSAAQVGKVDMAILAFKKVTELNPNYPDGYNNFGNVLQEKGALIEAIGAYKKALTLKPNYTQAIYNLGNCFKKKGDLAEAIKAYDKALFLNSDYFDAYNNKGNALKDWGKFEAAIASYKMAISLRPNHAEAYNNLGFSLTEQGELEEAIKHLKKALSLKSNYAEAYNNMGITLKDQSKLKEAIDAYNKALSLKPDYAEAHRNLSTLIKYKPDNPQEVAVSERIKRPDLKDDDRCHLHYTYAKMKEDLGELDVAFENYVAGGRLRQKLLSYDLKQDEPIFDQIKNTAPELKELSFSEPIEAAPNTPIFILGMPRSGTTLVEQIVSSHSLVHGSGELSLLSRFGGKLSSGQRNIDSNTLLKVRYSYLDELGKVSDNKRFVTDKMPHNFLHIGLILQAFPEAKIIHVKRDPAATCWSNFKHYFSHRGLGYSYDLNDTVSYYKLYHDLMEFWDQHYGNKIYHLDYDKLTIEQEIETRKLIEYLKLGWEDDCLSPHKNKRSVRTASQQQVREKVYKGSSQAWRKFEPYLNGAFDELLT